MITALAVITLALVWLLHETDYLRVRLLAGPDIPWQQQCSPNPYLQRDEYSHSGNEAVLLMRDRCSAGRECKRRRNCDTFAFGVDITRKIGSSTLHLVGCPVLAADRIAEAEKIQAGSKSHVTPRLAALPQFVREEPVYKNRTTGYRYRGYGSVLDHYKTVYAPSLPGKRWLRDHAKDTLPEPTIDITCNGKPVISVNGNYRRGIIKTAMKAAN